MIRKYVDLCLVVLCLIGFTGTALAQNSELPPKNPEPGESITDPLVGFWKQERESIYIQIVNLNGVYQAEMLRNDWVPVLVGTLFFQNVVEVKKNRWAGDGHIQGSDRLAKASLRMNGSGTKLTIRHRPGGSKTWMRTDPIKKRY